jgi:hypothetical protein
VLLKRVVVLTVATAQLQLHADDVTYFLGRETMPTSSRARGRVPQGC